MAAALGAVAVVLWAFSGARVVGLGVAALFAGGALLFLVLRRFEMFVLAVLACRSSLDVFKIGDRTSMSIDPAALLAVVLIVAGLWWLSLDLESWRQSRSPARAPLVALVLCGGFSLITAAQPVVSGVELLRVVAVVVMVMALERLVNTPAYLRLLLGALLVSCVVPIVVGLYQAVTGTGEKDLGGFARLTGTFLHPNPFAFYLALMIVMGVAVLPHLRGRVAGADGAGTLRLRRVPDPDVHADGLDRPRRGTAGRLRVPESPDARGAVHRRRTDRGAGPVGERAVLGSQLVDLAFGSVGELAGLAHLVLAGDARASSTTPGWASA